MDAGHARENLLIGVGAGARDDAFGTTHWCIEKWDQEQEEWATGRLGRTPGGEGFAALGVRPYETADFLGNLITNAGWTLLMGGVTGASPTQFSSSVGRIGVGSGTTAPAATDTALTTAIYYNLAGANFTLGTRTMSLAATFPGSGANAGTGTWNEFGIDQGTAGGTTVVATFLNHAAPGGGYGTKVAGQSWTVTATITFT